jgi:hypothetical protein
MSAKVCARNPRVETVDRAGNCTPCKGLSAMNTPDFIETAVKVNDTQRSCFVMQSIDILGDNARKG